MWNPADVHISLYILYIFMCFYVYLHVFCVFLYVSIFFHIQLIVNKWGAPEVLPIHYPINFILKKLKDLKKDLKTYNDMWKYTKIYKKSKPQCNMVSIFLLAKFRPSTVHRCKGMLNVWKRRVCSGGPQRGDHCWEATGSGHPFGNCVSTYSREMELRHLL